MAVKLRYVGRAQEVRVCLLARICVGYPAPSPRLSTPSAPLAWRRAAPLSAARRRATSPYCSRCCCRRRRFCCGVKGGDSSTRRRCFRRRRCTGVPRATALGCLRSSPRAGEAARSDQAKHRKQPCLQELATHPACPALFTELAPAGAAATPCLPWLHSQTIALRAWSCADER